MYNLQQTVLRHGMEMLHIVELKKKNYQQFQEIQKLNMRIMILKKNAKMEK